VDPTVPVLLTAKLRKIGICCGNWPIADFFHDQTIFIKDYELYTIGHSLERSILLELSHPMTNVCLLITEFLPIFDCPCLLGT
jgi:hypothetical protein